MFNWEPFNTIPFNDQTDVWLLQQWDLVYNGYSLSWDNIIISSILNDNAPTSEINSFYLPRDNWGTYLNRYFREKTITIKWILKVSSLQELNTYIDTFKKVFCQINKNLDIKVDWTIRRAKATLINSDSIFEKEFYNITWIPFTLQFQLLEFQKEITNQAQDNLWVTTDLIEEIFNEWTATTNPIITVSVITQTSLSSIIFSTTATDNQASITVTETFSNSDVITIDCSEKSVKLNGTEIDYSWIFPEFLTWNNPYSIVFTSTAHNCDINISYFNNFL